VGAEVKLPKIIEAKHVAQVLGWPTYKARRWLLRSGAARKIGSRWVTTAANLMAHFPEAFQAAVAESDDTEEQ
jgi:hypothetical protein